MLEFITRVVTDRVGGEKPSPGRAVVTAAVAGAAAAGITYRALRG